MSDISHNSKLTFELTFWANASACILSFVFFLCLRYQKYTSCRRNWELKVARKLLVLPVYEPLLLISSLGFLGQTLLLAIPGPYPKIPSWFLGAAYQDTPEELSQIQSNSPSFSTLFANSTISYPFDSSMLHDLAATGVDIALQWKDALCYFCYWLFSETVFEGFALSLVFTTPSPEACTVSFSIAFLYAVFASAVATVGFEYEYLGLSDGAQLAVDCIFVALPCLLYAPLLFGRLFRFKTRPCLQTYATFALTWRLMSVTALVSDSYRTPLGLIIATLRSILSPLVMYYTLLLDTSYWRSLVSSAVLQSANAMGTYYHPLPQSASPHAQSSRQPELTYGKSGKNSKHGKHGKHGKLSRASHRKSSASSNPLMDPLPHAASSIPSDRDAEALYISIYHTPPHAATSASDGGGPDPLAGPSDETAALVSAPVSDCDSDCGSEADGAFRPGCASTSTSTTASSTPQPESGVYDRPRPVLVDPSGLQFSALGSLSERVKLLFSPKSDRNAGRGKGPYTPVAAADADGSGGGWFRRGTGTTDPEEEEDDDGGTGGDGEATREAREEEGAAAPGTPRVRTNAHAGASSARPTIASASYATPPSSSLSPQYSPLPSPSRAHADVARSNPVPMDSEAYRVDRECDEITILHACRQLACSAQAAANSPSTVSYKGSGAGSWSGFFTRFRVLSIFRNQPKPVAGSLDALRCDHEGQLIDFSELTVGPAIGRGEDSVVYLGNWRGSPVALKMYRPRDLNEDAILAFHREVAIAASLSHPNCMPFYGLCLTPPHITLVLALAERGSLGRVIDQLQAAVATRRRQSLAMSSKSGGKFVSRTDPSSSAASAQPPSQQPQGAKTPLIVRSQYGRYYGTADTPLSTSISTPLPPPHPVLLSNRRSTSSLTPYAPASSPPSSAVSRSPLPTPLATPLSSPVEGAVPGPPPSGTAAAATPATVAAAPVPQQAPPITLSWRRRLVLAVDSARAVWYLHTQFSPPIVHRDLKSYNFLVTREYRARLSDFGTAIVCPAISQSYRTRRRAPATATGTDGAGGSGSGSGASPWAHGVIPNSGVVGTPGWLAPEMTRGEAYGTALDIFGLGLVLWEIAALTHPTQASEMAYTQYDQRVALFNHRPSLSGASSWPKGYAQLVRDCWHANPQKRPCAATVLRRLEAIAASYTAQAEGQGAVAPSVPSNGVAANASPVEMDL